ncbi:unnamed protein product [Mytilus coruscus]|uniref:MAM domain-containing protein n=1 Tax=Mytilus coruscus TaxID=42192 RepID=A0A6J8D7E4_MYTCO|nr:unnamed protein product [Mytilus coruscus]
MQKVIVYLLLLGLFSVTLQISDRKEVTIPVSSPILLECDDGFKVNNIEVTIRRSNTACLATTPECTIPNEAIETIKETCSKQVSCDVDIRNITSNHICLQEYGYFNVRYACKTRTGNYVYIYTPAFGSIDGDVAKLESGRIIALKYQCFSFWYFTTNYRDSVHVFQNDDHLLDLSYNEYEENIWHHIKIPLKKKPYTPFKLVFKVTRGHFEDGSFGAIVIDDIVIVNNNCDSYILMCDFETSSCGWNDDYSNQYIWKKQNGEPQSPHSGPSTDHSTASGSGYYLYMNSRFGRTTTAYMDFHNHDISLSGFSCLTFWYHMYIYNAYRKEGLNVTIGDTLVWTKFGNQDNKWIKATIDLDFRKISNIKFIGFLGGFWSDDIAIDDISLTEGTCKGLIEHEEICVDLDDDVSTETYCPKGYLDFTNARLSFDPEKNECSEQYEKTTTRLLQECKDEVDDSQKCSIDLSTDITAKPECFLLHEFRIRHTCEAQDTTTILSSITSRDDSIAGMFFGISQFRHIHGSGSKEKVRNDLQGNDYIGCQDIALLPTTDRSIHGQSSSRNTNTNTQINNVQHTCTNLGTDKEFLNDKTVQSPAYAVRRDETFADNQTSNGDEYVMVDPIAETSFNETIDSRTETTDSYMVLDPTVTGFNRTQLSKTPTGYEFAKPVKDTEKKIANEDQYALSEEGVYDHSGSNRHKELEDNIYNHAVDTIYDSGRHKRHDQGREDTYDHFFGQKTEDDYDISTTT